MNLTTTAGPSNAVQKEILALRRIACAQSAAGWPPGMWELDRYLAIEIDDGEFKAEIDFYSQHQADGPDWNVDAWDAEKLELRTNLVTREGFRVLHRMVRGLLSGKSQPFKDSPLVISRQSHLHDVRERGDGSRVTIYFEIDAGVTTPAAGA